VLEIGSGSGEHAVRFASAFPGLEWQPSDPDPDARESIEIWTLRTGLPNLRPPLNYDLRVQIWRLRPADAVLCVNVLHVAPAECGSHLCAGAARILPDGGPLVVYGPFTRRGVEPSDRLRRLDGLLRDLDPALGVREVEPLVECARRSGLALAADIAMPNEGDLLLVFRAVG
jgi:hypothetical protein